MGSCTRAAQRPISKQAATLKASRHWSGTRIHLMEQQRKDLSRHQLSNILPSKPNYLDARARNHGEINWTGRREKRCVLDLAYEVGTRQIKEPPPRCKCRLRTYVCVRVCVSTLWCGLGAPLTLQRQPFVPRQPGKVSRNLVGLPWPPCFYVPPEPPWIAKYP